MQILVECHVVGSEEWMLNDAKKLHSRACFSPLYDREVGV